VIRATAALLIVCAAAFEAVEATLAQAPAQAPRSIVVVSDMHMGVGRTSSGGWHPFEDFRWSSEFAAFLKAVDQEGHSAVDLVLNGDTFELLQSTVDGCNPPDTDAGCREAEALVRVERVLSAHGPEIDALAQRPRRVNRSSSCRRSRRRAGTPIDRAPARRCARALRRLGRDQGIGYRPMARST
jgi:hypothetical protein